MDSSLPVRSSDQLSIETTMRGIDPRADKDQVLMIVSRALDGCDPSETPTVQITRCPGA
jgi:hypothetical protein